MTVQEIFDKGGPVVWILLGYSIVAFALVLERLVHFMLQGRPPRDMEQRMLEALKASRALELLQGMRGPEATIMRSMLEASAAGVRDLGRVASRIGSEELQRMERGFRTLGVLGNTAPLLGLFGTITGMIKAFMVIEQAGGKVDAQALAGGIWEAMITTGVGLAVAIPVLLLLHVLEGMADRRAQAMRSCASLVLEQVPHGDEVDTLEPVHHREGIVHAV